MYTNLSMGVALVVVGWFASTVVQKLIQAFESFALQPGMEDHVERLNEALPKIQAVMDAVEHGQITRSPHQGLQGWMWQLRDALDEGEDVLDELKYQELEDQMKFERRNQLHNYASHLKKSVKRAFKLDPTLERLTSSVKRLDQVAADVYAFYNLIDQQAASAHQKHKELMQSRATGSIVSTATGAVHGRVNDSNCIIQLLKGSNSSSNNLSILAITGIGGVGKTTLAQYVYNDSRVEKHFDLRIWVWVPNVFDQTIRTKKILEGADKTRSAVDDLATLQVELKNKLSSKKYLLVLDDVWNENNRGGWETLFASLRYGKEGSRVLVTSRSENVKSMLPGMTGIYPLRGLQVDEFWLLFKECAFGDEVSPLSYQKLEGIGKQIASKLKGHPLAAKTIAGLLREKLNDEEYWFRMQKNISLCLGEGKNNVMSILRLSYQQLPAHLQSCFRYCSIFPQYYEFDRDRLVHMWMGAGLVQESNNEIPRLEDTGKGYFDDLLKKSFFDIHKDEYKDAKDYYKMHDLWHELAVSESVGECLRIAGNYNEGAVQIPETIRHLAVETHTKNVIKKITKLKHLRTLLFYYISDDRAASLHEFNQLESRGLRVFRLLFRPRFPNHSLEFLGDLTHLRYLDPGCSLINSLPESLCKLYHLQVLNVKGSNFCPPRGMSNLINLRHLISDDKSFFRVQGFGKLSSLENFHYCVENTSGYKMEELGGMNELRELCISDLQNIEHDGEASKAKLKEKNHIRRLELSWGSSSSVKPEMAEKVLDQLEPHGSLKDLEINGYTGINSPVWMRNLSSNNLNCLHLENCNNLVHIPPLWQLKFLRSLCLQKCPRVLLGAGRGHPLPSSLESLIIIQCRLNDKSLSMCLGGLTSLSNLRITGKHDDGMELEQLTSLPSVEVLRQLTSLRDLTISDFPKLTGLAGLRAARSLRTLKLISLQRVSSVPPLPTSLERLHVDCCHPELVKRCRAAEGADWHNIAHVRNIRID